MAWYEAHQTLAKHPKTLKLASLLKVERRYAVGLLHDLFSWALDSAKKDGTLPGMDAEEIASALDFTGKKATSVVTALVESGYLENAEGTYKIHDWYDYAGKLMDKRENDKKRKNEWKERGKNAERTRTEQGNPLVTVPNRTVPNITKDSVCKARAGARAREDARSAEPDPDRWGEFWDAYPRKSGGDIREACLEYMHVIDSGVPPETLIAAAKDLAGRTDRENFRYLPAAQKWLRNRGWLEKVPDSKDVRTDNIFLQMYEEEYGE